MDRERTTWETLTRAAVDGAALLGAWLAAVGLRVAWPAVWSLDVVPGDVPVVGPLDGAAHAWLAVLVVPLGLAVLAWRGDLRPPMSPTTSPWRLLVSSGVLTAALALGLFVLDVEWVSRLVVLGFPFVLVPALVLGRVLRRAIVRGRSRAARVVLVGPPERAAPLAGRILAHPEWGMRVVGSLDAEDTLHDVIVEEGVAEVIVVGAGAELPDLARVARVCDELGVRLSLEANFLGLRVGRAQIRDLDGFGIVSFAATPGMGLELAVKRGVDVVGALAGLVLAGPLLLALALAVRLQDGGPALFVQTRTGLHGRTFRMFKLRSMRVGAEALRQELDAVNEVDGPVFKLRQDPRITGLGRWLRRTSLDELPQLLNVLRGDMSLVGPRPPLPDEVAEYEPWQLRRLSMRPGLTGLWQVSGRSAVPFERWMALDLEYIDRWSLWLDLELLLRTVPAVVSGRGAW